MKSQILFILLFLLFSASVLGQEYPWGKIGSEQIEDVYLRNDRPDVMEGDTASLTIRATTAVAPEHVLLNLDNSVQSVFSAQADGSLQLKGNLEICEDFLFANSATEKLGLGTDTPTSRLHVMSASGDSNCALLESETSNCYLLLRDNNGENSISNSGNNLFMGGGTGTISLRTNWVNRLKVDIEGRVGIGTSTPDKMLDVHGEIVQDYGSSQDLAVPAMIDHLETPKPLIYYGTCSDGSVEYLTDGYPVEFKNDCSPVITLTPINLSKQGTTAEQHWYYWHITSADETGFTYRLYRYTTNTSTGTVTESNVDCTSTYTMNWQAMGWVD